jgi:hypothetical protein
MHRTNALARAFAPAFAVAAALAVTLGPGSSAAADSRLPLTVLPGAQPARDRLVEACEVAVLAHADRVALHFTEARRSGLDITLDVQVDGPGGRHIGEAHCSFREMPPHEPPSLLGFEALGKSGYGLFLVSHHAIWSHFTRHLRPPVEAGAPEREPLPSPSQPRRGPAVKAG